MPLQRRLPKRGFTNIFKQEFQIVNLEDLEECFDAGANVDALALAMVGLIRHPDRPIKLLARGAVTKALQVHVTRASQAALSAVSAAGGSVTVEN